MLEIEKTNSNLNCCQHDFVVFGRYLFIFGSMAMMSSGNEVAFVLGYDLTKKKLNRRLIAEKACASRVQCVDLMCIVCTNWTSN